MVSIGKLDHRIYIQKPLRHPDGMGGYTATWCDECTVWAQFLAPRFRQSTVEGDAAANIITQGIAIRKRPIEKGWRCLYNGRIFNILHVDDHVSGKIILTTEEVQK